MNMGGVKMKSVEELLKEGGDEIVETKSGKSTNLLTSDRQVILLGGEELRFIDFIRYDAEIYYVQYIGSIAFKDCVHIPIDLLTENDLNRVNAISEIQSYTGKILNDDINPLSDIDENMKIPIDVDPVEYKRVSRKGLKAKFRSEGDFGSPKISRYEFSILKQNAYYFIANCKLYLYEIISDYILKDDECFVADLTTEIEVNGRTVPPEFIRSEKEDLKLSLNPKALNNMLSVIKNPKPDELKKVFNGFVSMMTNSIKHDDNISDKTKNYVGRAVDQVKDLITKPSTDPNNKELMENIFTDVAEGLKSNGTPLKSSTDIKDEGKSYFQNIFSELLTGESETKFKPIDITDNEIEIAGMDDKIQDMYERVTLTRNLSKEKLKKLHLRHEKGLLLYGPPGTGKTVFSMALAKRLSNNCIIIKGPELMAKWYGQTEENVRNIFNVAKRNPNELYVIIIDEFDALVSQRTAGADNYGTQTNNKIVAQFLSMIDGPDQQDNIFIMGTTNRKEDIDPAILRPGRIGIHLEIGMPNDELRLQIIKYYFEPMVDEGYVIPFTFKDLVMETSGVSPASIAEFSRTICIRHLQKKIPIPYSEILELIKKDDKSEFSYYI